VSALDELHALVGDEGGPVGGELAPRPAGEPMPHAEALTGPRSAGRPAQYALVLEAIWEGFALHHAAGRLFEEPDGDLAVLLGDHMYALGIERLVALQDIPAVAALADTIALASLAAARGDEGLSAAVWAAAAAAVANGTDAPHEEAKDRVRRGEQGAAEALRASARQLAASR
jgi:hypothetical protein